MRRWFVIVQLYAHAIWRDCLHERYGEAFKYRRDAERFADHLRRRYADPTRWNVVVVRRRVKE